MQATSSPALPVAHVVLRIVIILSRPGGNRRSGSGWTVNVALPVAVANRRSRAAFGSRNPPGLRTRSRYPSNPGRAPSPRRGCGMPWTWTVPGGSSRSHPVPAPSTAPDSTVRGGVLRETGGGSATAHTGRRPVAAGDMDGAALAAHGCGTGPSLVAAYGPVPGQPAGQAMSSTASHGASATLLGVVPLKVRTSRWRWDWSA